MICKNLTKDTLSYLKNEKFLEESKINFPNKTLCLFEVKNTFSYKHLIHILCELFIDTPAIIIWKSVITDEILSKTDSLYWEGKILTMVKSSIENIMSGKC